MTLHAFVAGELLRDTERKTSQKGTGYTAALLRVDDDTIINLSAFDPAICDRLAGLRKGAALACSGRLQARPCTDRDGTLRAGLSVVVLELLIGTAPPTKAQPRTRSDRTKATAAAGEPFDDPLPPF